MKTQKRLFRSNFSRQRDTILRVLRSTKTHPTAAWIYEKVREEIPKISLGTVYRNLNTLADKGEILRFNVGDDTDRFDGTAAPHYHLFCNECKRVIDIPMPYIKELDKSINDAADFSVSHHQLCFFGICSDCKAKK